MGIRIFRIPVNATDLKNWLNNEGFVCLEDEEYYPTTYAHLFFDEALRDHYREIGVEDDHDYTFNDWREENEIYTQWDINHQYCSDNWEWEVIVDENDEVQWLIIAVKEY